MNIPLSADIEQALGEAAEQQGTTPEVLAADCIRARFLPASNAIPSDQNLTLADRLAEHIGVIDSGELVPGGANLSIDTGKKFTELLLKQREQGRR